MHGMAGLLEQMDHKVDPLAKDEENQQNKSLKRESCVCTRKWKGGLTRTTVATMAPMRKYITSSSFSAFASAARKLFSRVASPPPAELMTLSIWSTSAKSNSHLSFSLKTDLTSLLDEPENPECDCASQKHSNHPPNDGVHNPSSEKAEEEGDD